MTTITKAQLIAMNPCDRDERLSKFGDNAAMNAEQAFEAGFTIKELLWVATKLGLRSQQSKFALECAKRVAHFSKDTRVADCLTATENYINDSSEANLALLRTSPAAHAAYADACAAHAAYAAAHAAYAHAAYADACAAHAYAHAAHAAAHAAYAAHAAACGAYAHAAYAADAYAAYAADAHAADAAAHAAYAHAAYAHAAYAADAYAADAYADACAKQKEIKEQQKLFIEIFGK